MDFKQWKQAWEKVSPREQRLLLGLAVSLLIMVGYTSIWQPIRQRLEVAERHYRQQAELSARIQRAEPARDTRVVARSLSVRVNDSAAAAGLEIAEMERDGDSLRLAVSGDAARLLDWLDQHEREGAVLQSLTLQAREGVLDARVEWRQVN
ncbi:type II secretion system protein GspM [Pseudomonas sp. SMV71]|uniref:type II secretion system protein GspM n=1 Tax=Pseudomonas sp. SMV71 TaxID=3390195 RepID=UPI003F865394